MPRYALVKYLITKQLNIADHTGVAKTSRLLYGAKIHELDPYYKNRSMDCAVVPIHSISHKLIRME